MTRRVRRPSSRRALAVGLLGLITFALLLWAVPFAGAQFVGERILRYDVDLRIEAGGAIRVAETIDYVFAGFQKHGIYRDIPVRVPYDETYDRIYPLQVLSVRGSPGTPVQYDLEDEGDVTRIRIGDPDRTISGLHTYEIVYRVEGALNGFEDHDELYWNAIGPDWSVPIEEARVRVTAPAGITQVFCFSGPFRSALPCGQSGTAGQDAVFAHGSLPPFNGLTVAVAFPPGAVPKPMPILEERWSLARAFEATPLTVGVSSALLVAVVGGFALLVWRTGRDRRYAGSPVDVVHGSATGEEHRVPVFEEGEAPVEFAPPDGLRPGQVGTLMDEAANPLDVTATIIDLAVRGFLVIEEIPKKGWFGKPDWKLAKLRGGDDLLEYERLLLDGLFEDGEEVKLSELRTKFVSRLKRVQAALYGDALGRRWFPARPDKVKARWMLIGSVVVLVGGGLLWAAIRLTHLALLPIPIVLAGLLLRIGSRWMPRRTARGTALVRRVQGFRRVIETAETNLARFAEQENIFYRFLPYAIVFGCTEKWAGAFAGLAQQPQSTSWYVSPHPFTLGSFSDAMDGFTVTTAGTIASRPSSSGGSGGFSGGGGGGGGGGSW